ncbi:serine/threonine-protein phosphatase 6 regulatory ankyrin repeat subunit B-like isoform X1 [Ostrea edulis]|uniref:serine/threonine-protein phosphatase 6 regulatory ankyrin repeat subunit B-like isoform X1 n=1 Tax=Ostrea edulis TaxID=37623 RepID=UPI0020947112|nr:serine/threonine-protein phosphatase 6 regulatory ankyrin repeat subunit B-like isoform X1 [Ostrea edulis]
MMVESPDIVRKFYMAAVKRDLSKIEDCVLIDGLDVNYIFTEPYIPSHHVGGTALHITAEKGHTDLIEGMLMLGANLCLENKSGDSAMHIACKHGNSQAVLSFLNNNHFSKNLQNNHGITPLMRAIFRYETAFKGRYLKIVKSLIEYGCDVNLFPEHSKTTPLHMAAEKWDPALCELLISAGAQVNAKDSKGCTPLFTAVARMKISSEVVKVLVKAGTQVNEINANGRSPLHITVSKNDDLSVVHLLEGRANPNVADNAGLTPLVIAVHENNTKIVSQLLSYGADVNYLPKEQNSIMKEKLSILGIAVSNENVKMCKLLLQTGSDILENSLRGRNLLTMAARKENLELVKLFLKLNYPSESLRVMFPINYLSYKAADIFLLLLKWAIYPDVDEFEECLAKLDDSMNDITIQKKKAEELYYSACSLRDICCNRLRGLLGLNIHKKLQELLNEGHIAKAHVDIVLLQEL